MENRKDDPRTSTLLKLVPTWKGNLSLFGLLIIIVLGYFYWQVKQGHQAFLKHARLNSEILAGMIKRNAGTAVLSQEIVEEIMQTFLGNTARFVDYLNDIEPFSSNELASFAHEAGLAGIRIAGGTDGIIEGPLGWFPDEAIVCGKAGQSLRHQQAKHLYYLVWPRKSQKGCVIVGITAVRIEKLQKGIGLPHLLETLSSFGHIRYVRIDPGVPHSAGTLARPEVKLIDTARGKIAETRLSLGKEILVVGTETRHFFGRVKRLWREFFIFSALLGFLGIGFSWLLHRFQSAYLKQARDFERELARQHEDAALGRAAASITHEIKNPLNAISMGLQRLEIEAEEITEEHQDLVTNMLKAVKRMDGIIKDMRRYARPLAPNHQRVRLDTLVANLLTLYRKECEALAIGLTFDVKGEGVITGDRDMIEEALENLVKNGIEAQPDGGFLRITIDRRDSDMVLSFENGGFSLPAEETERILEPYFTTKTRGTGLGLSITRRIIQAHDGRLIIEVPEEGLLRVAVYLPAMKS
jgi:signal transduction histidine kinase